MEELETALALSGQPVKRGTMAHRHIIYMMLTEAAAHLRDASALQRYALSLEELAERDEHRPYLAVAHRACGIAHRLKGEFARAENRLANALDVPWLKLLNWPRLNPTRQVHATIFRAPCRSLKH